MIPNSPAAHNLLHQGAIALARVEAAGMRVDAIDWGGTVHMAPAFVAEIREALKGGVRCG